jgi:hypothetical protein
MKHIALVALASIGIAACSDASNPTAPIDRLAPSENGSDGQRLTHEALRDLTAGRIVPSPFSLTSPLTLMAGNSCSHDASDDRVVGSLTITLTRVASSPGHPAHYSIVFSGVVQSHYAPGKMSASVSTPAGVFAGAMFAFKSPVVRQPYATISGQDDLSIAAGDKLYQSNNVALAITHWLDFSNPPKPRFCARFNSIRS